MSIKSILCVLAVVTVMAAALLISNYAGFFTFKERIEAFADGGNPNEEEGPDIDDGGGWVGWYKGYEPQQIPIVTGSQFAIWLNMYFGININVTIENIWCCIKGPSEMVACDKSTENSQCSYYREFIK